MPCWENINREETVQISSETKDLSVNAVEQLLTNTLGSSRARFHLLIPINGLVHPDEANSQSLVILFEHFGSSILFTGDATKDTLEAILGDRTSDSKAEDETKENFFISATKSQIEPIQQEEYFNIISAISKRNRRLLKCVNLIMESHHGSDEKGCDLWVPQIIKLSGDNFCGVLSSSDPLDGPYGHARHTVVSSVKFPDSAKSISKDVLTCSVVEPGHTSDRFQIKTAKTKRNIFQTAFVSAYQILFRDEGMAIYHADLASPLRLTSSGGFSLYTQDFWDLFLQGDEKSFWQLYGALQANSSLLKTSTLLGYSPLALQLNLLPCIKKAAFLSNVDAFIEKFKISPMLVFGKFSDIGTLSDDIISVPIFQKSSVMFKNRFTSLPPIDIPTRTVYGGNQGIHELDIYFQQNPDTIDRFQQEITKGSEVSNIPEEDLSSLLVSFVRQNNNNLSELTEYILQTIVNHIDVLQTTINSLTPYKELFQNLIECLETAVEISKISFETYNKDNLKKVSWSEFFKSSLLNYSFNQKINDRIEQLIRETVGLMFLYIEGNSIGLDIQKLVNLIPYIKSFFEDDVISKPILQILFDNVLMGGWCAQGYRNRLFNLLWTQWQSFLENQDSN